MTIENKNKAYEEAVTVLAFLQNIDDFEEAEQFAKTWIKSVNASLRAQSEAEIDETLFMSEIAETDTRFNFF